jgi:adenine C2-methylase RlmN of 23S rRNA A2503 and tRNA A37
MADVGIQTTQHRIVLQQVGVGLRIRRIVDSYHFQLAVSRVNQQRKKLRPMRPKPLIATLITAFNPLL